MIIDNICRYDLPKYLTIQNKDKRQADANNKTRLRKCEYNIKERMRTFGNIKFIALFHQKAAHYIVEWSSSLMTLRTKSAEMNHPHCCRFSTVSSDKLKINTF